MGYFVRKALEHGVEGFNMKSVGSRDGVFQNADPGIEIIRIGLRASC